MEEIVFKIILNIIFFTENFAFVVYVGSLFVCLFISNMVQRKATSYLLAADGSAA